MSEATMNSEEIINYDHISRSLLVRKLLSIDNITLSPKALNRIMETVQNMPPCEVSDKPNCNY